MRKDFGIYPVPSRSQWSVRLRSESSDGQERLKITTVNWKSHGGKANALIKARMLRDELLNHPDVKRYRRKRETSNGIWFRPDFSRQNKIAFPNLVGINLVQQPGPNRDYYGVRAIAGADANQDKPVTFSMLEHGVKGALLQAIAHREKLLGKKLYTKRQIQDDYNALLADFREKFEKSGIDLGDKKGMGARGAPWRKMTAEDLREALPPSPHQPGASLIISSSKKYGKPQATVVMVGYITINGITENRFYRSLGKGVWSVFRDCINEVRKARHEPALKPEELLNEYRLWLRGYTKKMQDIGFDLDTD